MSTEKMIRLESSVPMSTRVSIVDLAKLDIYWLRVEKVYVRSMSHLISMSIEALVDLIERNGKMPEIANDMTVKEAHNYLMERQLYQQTTLARSRSRIGAMQEFETLREQGLNPEYESPGKFNTIHSKHASEHLEPQQQVKKAYDPVEARNYLQRMRNGQIPESEMLGNWKNLAEALKNRKLSREEIEKYRDKFSENSGISKEKLIIPETADEELKRAQEEYRKEGRIAEEPVRVSMRPQDNIYSGIISGREMNKEQVAKRMEEIAERDKKIREMENAPIDIEWMKSQGRIVANKDNSIIEETQSASAHCSTSNDKEERREDEN